MRKSARFAWDDVALRRNPYLPDYRAAFAFSALPMPAPPTAFLAVSLPEWAAIRVFRVPPDSHGWFRSCLFTGSVPVRAAPWIKGGPTTFAFWARPVSVFGLFSLDDVYQQFRYLDHAIQSRAPSALTLAEAHPSHDFSVACAGVPLSRWLQTLPLPATHVLIDYGRRNARSPTVNFSGETTNLATFTSHNPVRVNAD
jgi:hypothetical protein